MADGFKVRWVQPPEDLGRKIEELGKKLFVVLHAVAANWGASIQNQARGNARWEDRTGNARSGLMFAVDGFGLSPVVGSVTADKSLNTDSATISGSKDRLVIALGHTVFYGKFLELNGKYAVVMSTIESNIPRLETMLRGILQ